jgi:hypothetical protein
MSDFLIFRGSAEKRGDAVRLTAEGGNGSIELADGDVRVEGGQVRVRRGAIALFVGEPHTGDASARPGRAALQGLCPSGITCCIGSVQLCCDDFRVIGPCQGAWGCAKSFTF